MVPLKCVGCGAGLEIEVDMDVFACAYCGTNQRVEAKGGTISLKPVAEALQRVQRGTDRTAAELAIPRLKRELEDLLIAHRQALSKPVPLGNNAMYRWGIWAIALAVFIFLLAAMFKTDNAKGATIGLGVLTLLFGVAFSWIGSKWKSGAQRAKLKAAQDQINNAYNERADRIRTQMAAHRKILDADVTA